MKKPEIYEEEHNNFINKKIQFKKELLLYEAANLLVSRGMLSEEDVEIYKVKLLHDKRFSTQIHCLFEIFNSIELVEKNIDSVYYHIKTNLKNLKS